MRHDLRQEPYAVTLHVRICAGGGGMTVVPTATEVVGLRQSVSERAALKGTVTILRMFLRRMVAVPLGTGHVLAALHLHHGLREDHPRPAIRSKS